MQPESAQPQSAARPVTLSEVVGRAATRLQGAYLGQRGDREQARARGTLAELRRAVGVDPQRDPLAWQAVLDEVIGEFPESLVGRGMAPSRAEQAAFDALTLFALHMQSARTPMHVRDQSFAKAVGLLTLVRNSASIKPRFDAVLAVRAESVRRHHLRGLIALLRTEGIGFDYGWLANDLVRLDDTRFATETSVGSHRNGVLLAWGRDFASARFRSARAAEPGSTSTTQ